MPSAQGVPRDDRFVELGTAGGDAGLGLGLGHQRGDVGQHLGGQEGPGLLGLGGYFCLGGDLLDLPPGHPRLTITQHHPHPGALGREETEIGRSHEESFRDEKRGREKGDQPGWSSRVDGPCCRSGESGPYHLPRAAPDQRFLPIWPRARGVGENGRLAAP